MDIDGPEYLLNHPNNEAPVPSVFLFEGEEPVKNDAVIVKDKDSDASVTNSS